MELFLCVFGFLGIVVGWVLGRVYFRVVGYGGVRERVWLYFLSL